MEKNNNCGIYGIINTINQKIYIGSSNNIKKRKLQHLSCLRNGNHRNNHLQKSFNQHKEEEFEFKIIKLCKEEELIKWEQVYINKYNSTNFHCGYNLELKADRSIVSVETREKISKTLKGRIKTEETRRKLSIANKGKKRTKEQRKKQGEMQKGKKRSEESKKKQSETMKGILPSPQCMEAAIKYNTGKKLTAERIEKLRQVHIGVKQSTETIKKRKQSRAGYTHTEETRKRISKGNAGKKRTPEMNERNRQERLKYKEHIEEWKKLRMQGLTYTEIGEKYNIADNTVWKYLNKIYPMAENIKIDTRKYSHYIKEWQDLENQGWNCFKIAKKYNIKYDTIKSYLKKNELFS